MVKITGSSAGLATVKHHIDYISRNGELELTNETGDSLHGRDDLKALQIQLKASQVPNDSNKREFLHVLFSMPPGTPEKEMRKAVAEFCKEEFGNRRYVMALHDDTDHTHVHVCVNTRDLDRCDEPRLSPRKADLFRWRQGFADKLRDQGVDAAASERRHRFNHRKHENPVVRQIRSDNPKSGVFNERRFNDKANQRAMNASAKPESAFVGALRPARVPKVVEGQKTALNAALNSGIRPVNPYQDKIEASRVKILRTWQEVHQNLVAAGDTTLAKELAALMREGEKPASSRDQELYDSAVKRNKTRDDHEL
jgi:Relaxase/Mobilisation nuclease domain